MIMMIWWGRGWWVGRWRLEGGGKVDKDAGRRETVQAKSSVSEV